MKNLILLLTITLLAFNLHSQTWQWANRMGSDLQDSINTSDYNEKIAGVGTDNAGNVYVAGKVMGYPTFGDSNFVNQSHGNYYQGFLAKYDCSGNLKWVQLMLDNNGADDITGLAVDASGDCYLNGFAGSNVTYFDTTQYTFGNTPGWFIAKFDSNGNNLWRTFTQVTPCAQTEGGPVININSQGNIIASGWNNKPGTVFPGINLRKGDFIAAFNPNTGNCLWGTNIDTVAPNSTQRYLEILSMKLGTDDDIYFTGWFVDTVKIGSYTLNAETGNRAFILKYNSNGNLIWAKQDNAVSDFTANQTMAVSGNFIYIFGQALRNDNFFGYNVTFDGVDIETNVILKLDTAANLIWGITQDSVNATYAGPLASMAADNNSNLYCTFGFGEKLKWGTTYPSISSNPANGPNPYLLKLNSSGQVLSLMSIPSYSTSTNPYDGGEGLGINNVTGDIYIGGAFSEKLWAHAGDTILNSGGNVDLFLVKYGSVCVTGIDEVAKDDSYIKVFPNPNNGNFTLYYHLTSVKSTLKLVDITGRTIYNQNLNGFEGTEYINVSDISTGIYFWQVVSENNIVLKGKIVVVK